MRETLAKFLALWPIISDMAAILRISMPWKASRTSTWYYTASTKEHAHLQAFRLWTTESSWPSCVWSAPSPKLLAKATSSSGTPVSSRPWPTGWG